MRVVTISGTQGSGKTTLIRKVIALLNITGRRSGLIVNEDGEEVYDQKFIEAQRVQEVRIRGG